VGDIDMYTPEKSNTKPCKLRLYATHPGARWGAYCTPANPLSGGEGLAAPSPRTPSTALGPSDLACPTPLQN